MRTNNPIAWNLMLWMGALAVMCTLATDAAAAGLVQAVPNLAVPATALGFTLISAASRDRQ